MVTMIDSLDKQLIDLLTQDARQSSDVLGKRLDVSSSTIRRRVKKLIEQGIINIIAVAEPVKVGLSVEAVIAFDVSHEKVNSILKAIRKYPQVRWAAAMSGRFDIMALVWFDSTEDLYMFMENEIGNIGGVLKSETFICLHVEKRS